MSLPRCDKVSERFFSAQIWEKRDSFTDKFGNVTPDDTLQTPVTILGKIEINRRIPENDRRNSTRYADVLITNADVSNQDVVNGREVVAEIYKRTFELR